MSPGSIFHNEHPRALPAREGTRWLRAVQRCLNPRHRFLALLPFYAGLRIGEAVALDVADVSLSARKGLVVVRSGKGGRCREIPLHPKLREQLAIYGSTTSAQHGRVPPPTPLHS